MRFRDRAANRQSHTDAILFRCEERVENLLRIWDPGERIGDFHFEHVFRAQTRCYTKNTALCRGVLHRLDGIPDKVDDDLLDLNAICHGARQGRVEVKLQTYIIRLKLVGNNVTHFLYDAVQLDQLP